MQHSPTAAAKSLNFTAPELWPPTIQHRTQFITGFQDLYRIGYESTRQKKITRSLGSSRLILHLNENMLFL